MALLHFDGFETYGVVPTSATATGVNATTPLGAAKYYGTAVTTATASNIARPATTNDPDRRTWLSSLNAGLVNTSWAVPRRYTQKYVEVTSGTKLTVGFKILFPVMNSTYYTSLLARVFMGNACIDVTVDVATAGSPIVVTLVPPTSSGGAVNTVVGSAYRQTLGPSSFQVGVANTVEIQLGTDGAFTVWINNSFVGTGQSQLSTTVDFGRGVMFAECGINSTSTGSYFPYYVTDLYILDDSGAAPTSRLGKVKVVTRQPTADVQAQLTRPSGAASNAAVAGQVPPSATNFLTGIADGDTDLYSAPAFGFSNEAIIATALTTSGYKTDATGNDIAPVLQIGGTVYEGPTQALTVGSSYSTATAIFATNPATGLKFTKADLDNAPFGVRVKDPNAD